jgi:hypothetical protein
MTPVLWVQLIMALIQGLTQLAKDPAVPADINAAKERLHAAVEALEG